MGINRKDRLFMKCYEVERTIGNCRVLLLPQKDGSGYTFINLTAGHICPCRFKTIDDALADMRNESVFIGVKEIPFDNI